MKVQTIAEQLLFSTVRIETDKGVGTGFIVNKKLDDKNVFCIITNKHVINESKEVTFFFIKSKGNKPLLGEKLIFKFEISEKFCFSHPKEDLYLINISPILSELNTSKINLFFRSISTNNFCTNDVEDYDAFENIIFVGYPNGIYDEKNLIPLIRTGITSTPYSLDYKGEKKFLIDASVFPGSSGSPVFVYNKGFRQTRDGTTHVGGGFGFLGVVSAVLTQDDKGELDFEEIPTLKKPIIRYKQLLDLGIVIKAECVEELINLYLEKIKGIENEN